jgi:AcrR family transcriptional regulator
MDVEGPLRERLVDAGAELALPEGTASVGLREIARRAGVSHGAPRRYFPTHRALLSAIARRGFEELGARSAAATAGTAVPRDELAALARVYVTYELNRRGMRVDVPSLPVDRNCAGCSSRADGLMTGRPQRSVPVLVGVAGAVIVALDRSAGGAAQPAAFARREPGTYPIEERIDV